MILERLRDAILKPVDAPDEQQSPAGGPMSSEELEDTVRFADDKERLIGLLAAPLAAAIGILVISALIVNDPAALLRSGLPNKLHVSLSLYYELGGVLIALSVLMLAMAMLRKRLLLGILLALYGLAVFNLHYWGFGIPFIMGGSWLLVRAYRLQRDLREATGTSPFSSRGRSGRVSTPAANKRYTPPSSGRQRSAAPRLDRRPTAG